MGIVTMADNFVRTESGKTEIQARARAMSRPARNLLMVIDASCSGQEWIAKVAGCSEDDLQQLVEAGLVVSADAVAAVSRVSLETALQGWTHDALYSLLTSEARERFGLIKGYRLVLRIEGCVDLPALQAVALEFVELLRKSHGEESAARFRRQLGATH